MVNLELNYNPPCLGKSELQSAIARYLELQKLLYKTRDDYNEKEFLELKFQIYNYIDYKYAHVTAAHGGGCSGTYQIETDDEFKQLRKKNGKCIDFFIGTISFETVDDRRVGKEYYNMITWACGPTYENQRIFEHMGTVKSIGSRGSFKGRYGCGDWVFTSKIINGKRKNDEALDSPRDDNLIPWRGYTEHLGIPDLKPTKKYQAILKVGNKLIDIQSQKEIKISDDIKLVRYFLGEECANYQAGLNLLNKAKVLIDHTDIRYKG